MNSFRNIAIAGSLSLFLGACGHLQFTNSKKEDTGLMYYATKPYVLVSRTGAKDKPMEIQVLYLPDLRNPGYVRPIPGLGSSDLSVTLSNGMITNIGQKTDPKLVELLGSIGTLTTSLATAQKTRAEAKALEQALEIGDGQELIEISEGIRKHLADPRSKNLTEGEKNVLGTVAANLERIGKSITAPGAKPDPAGVSSQLTASLNSWSKQVRKSTGSTDSLKAYFEQLEQLQNQLTRLIAKITPKEPAPPELTLYELHYDPALNSMQLIEVPIKTMEVPAKAQ